MSDDVEAIMRAERSPVDVGNPGDEEENLAVRTAAVVANYQASAQLEDTTSSDVAIDASVVLGEGIPKDETSGSLDYVMCNEKDVLMGRGKRISEWPGNQRFRTIVSKYRQAYLSSLRSAKIHVAKQVIVEVVSNGGRFLREIDPGNTGMVNWSKWLPVEMDRCIEKTCQALREKDKTTKRKMGEQPEGTPKDTKKVRPCGDNELLQRFQAFVQKNGHSAVPPGWEEDVELSDWVTVQRRLFKDIEEGILVERKQNEALATALDESLAVYDEGEKATQRLILETNETLKGASVTEEQQKIIDELRKLDFVTDYEDWHWEHSFKLFSEGDLTKKRVWLRQQRRNHREGTLSPARRFRLEAAGVNFMVNNQEK